MHDSTRVDEGRKKLTSCRDINEGAHRSSGVGWGESSCYVTPDQSYEREVTRKRVEQRQQMGRKQR